jgi:hypothetical protein
MIQDMLIELVGPSTDGTVNLAVQPVLAMGLLLLLLGLLAMYRRL